VLLSGCDVVNPGPVQDQFLNDPQSHAPLVAGAGRSLARAVKGLAPAMAISAREIFPGGQTGSCDGAVPGWSAIQMSGYFDDGQPCRWDQVQQARFIAEDAIDRFVNQGAIQGAESSPLTARAHVWAGYAYRVMGEHFCEVVFDGGAPEPASNAFQRAEAHFTEAIQVAGRAGDASLRQAALAGRAQARTWLGDWSGASSDAAEVPNDFGFGLAMDNTFAETRNRIYWLNANLPYRSYSIKHTFFEEYYPDTGDPRTPTFTIEAFPFANASLSGYGPVPFINQGKYTSPNDAIRLAGGREMRLIEAEALLVQGQWQQAMDRINQVRAGLVSDLTGQPLEAWTAGSAEDAWRMLKRERAIELWLEGRRFGDLRRWEEQGAPGAVDWPDYESLSSLFRENPRSRCLSIPNVERNANPNVPTDMPTDHLWTPLGARPGGG
jgi:starch-binding outer membrane protein, SusD/RagB family